MNQFGLIQAINVTDDFGDAVRVPSSLWYAGHPSLA